MLGMLSGLFTAGAVSVGKDVYDVSSGNRSKLEVLGDYADSPLMSVAQVVAPKWASHIKNAGQIAENWEKDKGKAAAGAFQMAAMQFGAPFLERLGLSPYMAKQLTLVATSFLKPYVSGLVNDMLGLGPEPTAEEVAAIQSKAAVELETKMIAAGVGTPEVAAKMQSIDPNMVETISADQAREAFMDAAVQSYDPSVPDENGNFVSKDEFCDKAAAEWEKNNPNSEGKTFQRVVTFDQYYENSRKTTVDSDQTAVEAERTILQNKYNSNIEESIARTGWHGAVENQKDIVRQALSGEKQEVGYAAGVAGAGAGVASIAANQQSEIDKAVAGVKNINMSVEDVKTDGITVAKEKQPETQQNKETSGKIIFDAVRDSGVEGITLNEAGNDAFEHTASAVVSANAGEQQLGRA